VLLTTIIALAFSAGLAPRLYDGGNFHEGGIADANENDDFGLLNSANDDLRMTVQVPPAETAKIVTAVVKVKSVVKITVRAAAATQPAYWSIRGEDRVLVDTAGRLSTPGRAQTAIDRWPHTVGGRHPATGAVTLRSLLRRETRRMFSSQNREERRMVQQLTASSRLTQDR
jgi:hypothetical protein